MEQLHLFKDTIELKTQLKDRYLIPPFSVIDKKQAVFKNLEKKYTSVDLNNGRSKLKTKNYKNNSIYAPKDNENSYISTFSPALAEILIKWFCVSGGTILDPFCGGISRGYAAGLNGFKYIGIDIRDEQIQSNKQILNQTDFKNKVVYITSDSDIYLNNFNQKVDMVIACPPYHDLEKYSELDNDLSNMCYDAFKMKYTSILHKCVSVLNDDSFLVIVLSDFRKKIKGGYFGCLNNFTGVTIDAINDKNIDLYNEGIILSAIGSAGMRADKVFRYRKLTKIHEKFLVFYKGDMFKIKEKFKL